MESHHTSPTRSQLHAVHVIRSLTLLNAQQRNFIVALLLDLQLSNNTCVLHDLKVTLGQTLGKRHIFPKPRSDLAMPHPCSIMILDLLDGTAKYLAIRDPRLTHFDMPDTYEWSKPTLYQYSIYACALRDIRPPNVSVRHIWQTESVYILGLAKLLYMSVVPNCST